jgi:hypothetical protein
MNKVNGHRPSLAATLLSVCYHRPGSRPKSVPALAENAHCSASVSHVFNLHQQPIQSAGKVFKRLRLQSGNKGSDHIQSPLLRRSIQTLPGSGRSDHAQPSIRDFAAPHPPIFFQRADNPTHCSRAHALNLCEPLERQRLMKLDKRAEHRKLGRTQSLGAVCIAPAAHEDARKSVQFTGEVLMRFRQALLWRPRSRSSTPSTIPGRPLLQVSSRFWRTAGSRSNSAT